jgi:hypothetical protein
MFRVITIFLNARQCSLIDKCALEMEITLVSETSCPIYQSHGVAYQKTVISTVNAVETSHLRMIYALSVANSQYPINPPINQHFIRILKDAGILLASCICVNLSFAPIRLLYGTKYFTGCPHISSEQYSVRMA